MDAATESVVGAENVGRWIAALIAVAADGLIVVERARGEHQRRERARGPAAYQGAADTETGTNRAKAVVADALSTLTLRSVTVEDNHANGGAAGLGGTDGQGVGGGLYLTPGGVACADLLTVIVGNHASTSNDDVFGVLCFI